MSVPVESGLAAAAMARDNDAVEQALKMRDLRKNLEAAKDPKKELMNACQGFETIFIQKMWEQMRDNIPKDGYLHSKEESMYQGMYDYEFSKKMASAGGIGLADMLYDQLAQRLGESSRTMSPGVSPRAPVVTSTASASQAEVSGAKGVELHPSRSAGLPSPTYEKLAADSGVVAAIPDGDGQKGIPLKTQPDKELATMESVVLKAGQSVAAVLPPQGMDFESVSHAQMAAELSGQEARVLAAPKKGSVLNAQQRGTLEAALLQSSQEAAANRMAQERVLAATDTNAQGAQVGVQNATALASSATGSPHGKLVGSVVTAESFARESSALPGVQAAAVSHSALPQEQTPGVLEPVNARGVDIKPAAYDQPAEESGAYPTFRITARGVEQAGGHEPTGMAPAPQVVAQASSLPAAGAQPLYADEGELFQPYAPVSGTAAHTAVMMDGAPASYSAIPEQLADKPIALDDTPASHADAGRIQRIQYNAAGAAVEAAAPVAKLYTGPFSYFRRPDAVGFAAARRADTRSDV